MEAQITEDDWTHFAYTGDSRNITLWINGFKITSKPYDGTLNIHLIFPFGMRLSSIFDDRSFQGLMDEVKINLTPFDQEYMKSRVLLIPIRLLAPFNGLPNVGLGQVLRWDRIKGPFRDIEYEVYLGEDAGNLPLVATTSGLVYKPTLDYDTTYYWCVKPIPQGTPSEIRSFKTTSADFEPLLAHWKLDEAAGAIINDSATGLNHAGIDWNYTGAIHGAGDPNWIDGWIAADRQSAAHFNGAPDHYIEIDKSTNPDSDPQAFNDLVLDSYSVALWVKVDEQGFVNNSAYFIALGDSYGLGRFAYSEHARFYAAGIADLQGSSDINDAQWHHLAAIYDLINLQANLYVDGQLEASTDFPPTAIHDGDTGPLLIGSNYLHPNQSLNGALDDVRIYRHHALTAPEIHTLYHTGFAHKRPAVNAGDNQIITGPAPYGTAFHGDIINDNLPPGDTLTMDWTQIDGPTTATLNPPDSLNPLVSDLAPGVYTFRLTAHDNAYEPYDEVKVWVQASTVAAKELLYLRFEEDITPADPLLLTVANEVDFGLPFLHVPPISDPDDPDYLAQLDPNVPLDPIPLTGAANQFSLGRPVAGVRLEGTVQAYPELTFAEEITVEFFADIADEDDLTFVDFTGEQSGFRIFNPRALKVQYVIEGDVPGRTESIELTATVKLSDCTTGSGENQVYHPVGWKHVAWTYDKATGISRILENGVPAYITHVNGVARPGELFYDGIDGRDLVMPLLLDPQNHPTQLLIAAGVDTEPGSLFDELRITAAPLLPKRLLIVVPNFCTEKLTADLNGDCIVNLLDFVIFANQWLKNTDPYFNN